MFIEPGPSEYWPLCVQHSVVFEQANIQQLRLLMLVVPVSLSDGAFPRTPQAESPTEHVSE